MSSESAGGQPLEQLKVLEYLLLDRLSSFVLSRSKLIDLLEGSSSTNERAVREF